MTALPHLARPRHAAPEGRTPLGITAVALTGSLLPGLAWAKAEAAGEEAAAEAEAGTSVPALRAELVDRSRESVPGGPLMIAAYAVMWVLVFAYVAALWRRQRTLGREVDRLEARLDERIGELQRAEGQRA